ncbi:PrgH/EprH family type III secretion apparatus protein [Solimicrobium silvestre]|uniref:PrgH: type III secretion apparatus protein PrgH/EprH n=1 Tax=Solimicrobium silvestre TaxID=2099400 RepID=A0A2S9H1L0_9BURK|nr:PrgH/EprH family type III secretion apparatus protein [Solimicrobium silvestre]PRC93875.1 PrgH: type III secretion apparatus protein PrgH/EprH [Solimicrobium silvestre]
MSLHFEVESPQVKAVLRLLSGPLCGCEYQLNDGVTLVVAGAVGTLLGVVDGKELSGMPEFPERAIVVPLEGGRNFEIIIDDNARSGFRLRTLEPQLEEWGCVYQEICQMGSLRFAVRPMDVDWEPGIVEPLLPLTEVVSLPQRRSWGVSVLIGAAALVVVLGLVLVLWTVLNEDKRVAEVASVVAGSSDAYRLVSGRDGAVYVFAKNERDVSWAKQALSREGLISAARVVTLPDEEARLGKLLVESYPVLAFYRMRLLDPAKPVLVLSQERAQISSQMSRELMANMMSWMPYAKSIDVVNWSDAMLDERAQAGLDRLGINYDRISNASSVTYVVQSSLTDIQLVHLQDFIGNYYREFGMRYIYFSVALKDDWLKGKSFKYGGSGYVKMTQQHWFFPQSF